MKRDDNKKRGDDHQSEQLDLAISLFEDTEVRSSLRATAMLPDVSGVRMQLFLFFRRRGLPRNAVIALVYPMNRSIIGHVKIA